MNEIALITGGSRGLGKDIALALAKKGKDIIVTYLKNKDKALAVVKQVETMGQKAIALHLDVSKISSYDAFFEKLISILKDEFNSNSFNYLINNAGIGIHSSYEDTTEEQFDTLLNIHLKSAFFLTQKGIPKMAEGGSIVNISTGLARFTLSGYDAYAVMKGGVETLTKYQAKYLGEKGIRVNVVAPGAIETDFGGGVVRDNAEIN
jgi:NAD(P)-dependent dehydrogenase (short-subunit alcohol dehydrogenase family)